ncbi:hypothetical protein [Cryobacterium sp. Y11]|uniref:hypothetical protein n=1 Tax=Cryobacterium sp. Y11 TaxID=2045016 RepID=UPI0018EBCAF7|nr:hypothetical protein [Cryobacterium sp. Y11]
MFVLVAGLGYARAASQFGFGLDARAFLGFRGAGANVGIAISFEFEFEVGDIGWAQLAFDATDTASFV